MRSTNSKVSCTLHLLYRRWRCLRLGGGEPAEKSVYEESGAQQVGGGSQTLDLLLATLGRPEVRPCGREEATTPIREYQQQLKFSAAPSLSHHNQGLSLKRVAPAHDRYGYRGCLDVGSVSPFRLTTSITTNCSPASASFSRTLVRYADDFLVLCKTPEALELTDYLLADLHLTLNREKTRTTSFDEGFKFLGAIFLKSEIYLPFDRRKPEMITPHFPPPLDLTTYLELKHLEVAHGRPVPDRTGIDRP